MIVALTRPFGGEIERCELTHLPRRAIDAERAARQHRRYEEALAALGCEVRCLPPEPALPDAVFVEDAAVVLPELAVVARPGAASRRPETVSVAAALHPYRRLAAIEAPATLDGGDVLQLGKRVFVGLSERTNREGLEQLDSLLTPFGYQVEGVEVRGCLHLKSAVTAVGEETLLLNREWVPAEAFEGFERIDVDPSEPFAANALRVGEGVLFPAAFPATRRRLEEHGVAVRTVEVSELAKAEGGVTCCSLVFGVVET